MRPSCNRRELLRCGAGALLALGLWPGALRARSARGAGRFCFVVLNDIHYLDGRCDAWLERVIGRIKSERERPEFCVLDGDLCEHGTVEQLGAVRSHFDGLGIPVYSLLGNHDYRSDTDRSSYEKVFPGRINYRFEHRGWQFIALDSTQGRRVFRTKVQQPALAWLDATLPRLEKPRPTVLLTHFPLGRTWVRPLNAGAVLDRFTDYNLKAVFSGHWHGHTECTRGGVLLATNRCCSRWRDNNDGTPEKGYFLCRAEEEGISRAFVEVKPRAAPRRAGAGDRPSHFPPG